MTNKIPVYIPLNKLSLPISFEWDGWDPYSVVGLNDYDTEQILSRITNHEKFVFSLGCAEWVITRLSIFIENDLPWQYLNACWAFELSDEYLLPYELNDKEWTGNVLEPICLALTTVINTRYGFDEDNAETDSAFAEKIALHVIPNSAVNSFYEWRNIVLDRLLQFYSVKNRVVGSERVPIDILDPSLSIDLDNISVLIKKSIEKLNLKNNPFLNKKKQR